jgi:hypothetical protein
MAVNNLTDLYTEYLIVSPAQTTATGFSRMVDNVISHDKITRLLAGGSINSKQLWQYVKPMCHEIQSNEGVLIIDDSVEEKPYTDQNAIINWHFDHCRGRCIKGVNFVSAIYHSKEMSLPVSVEFVKKTISYINKKGKLAYKSEKSKNEIFREMVGIARNNLYFKYVLADIWFSSAKNMSFIKQECRSDFILAIKGNRKVALSEEDKNNGKYVNIKSLELEGRALSVYFEQLDFPVLICKQVFKNKDGSTGTLYLASSDLSLSYEQMTTIYKKRWRVEDYHKSIKSNLAFAKSPTKRVVTQESHFIASIIAYVKLERMNVRFSKNHFALKSMLYIAATKAAYEEWQKLSTPNYELLKKHA